MYTQKPSFTNQEFRGAIASNGVNTRPQLDATRPENVSRIDVNNSRLISKVQIIRKATTADCLRLGSTPYLSMKLRLPSDSGYSKYRSIFQAIRFRGGPCAMIYAQSRGLKALRYRGACVSICSIRDPGSSSFRVILVRDRLTMRVPQADSYHGG